MKDNKLKGKQRKWVQHQDRKQWVLTAYYLQCLCGRVRRVGMGNKVICRCGVALTHEEGVTGMVTPFATIPEDSLEERIANGKLVINRQPEIVDYQWKLRRPGNVAAAVRKLKALA